MKNILPKLILLSLLTFCWHTVSAYDCEVDGIYYNLSGGEASVTYQKFDSSSYSYYSPYTGSVTIPSTITYNGEAYDVKSIEDYAFYSCSGLTAVTIPSSVTSIGYKAFSGCSGLTGVHISDLASWCGINFDSVDSTPLFYARHLFLNGVEVKELTIPNSVTSIGAGAFSGCSGLTSVTIPNGVASIGDYTFYNCSSLTTITLPNSVTSIGNSAFYGTAWLANQPVGVVYAGNVAYKYKGTMPDNTSITLREGTVGITDFAFNCGNQSLTSITIPNSVTSIGKSAFDRCTGLTAVHISDLANWYGIIFSSEGSNPLYWAHHLFLNGVEVKELTIPNSMTSIGNYAFIGCRGLTSVTIPNSVTTIGHSAFDECNILRDVYCYAENVPEAFSSSFPLSSTVTITLHVPEALYESYKATAPWSGFGLIVPIVKYHLTYVVDGVEYKSFEMEEGAAIVPEENPTKENYTFSGWSEIPATMPAHDVTVTGSFTCDLPKCATPTVTLLSNGQIEVECATEGAKCVTTVTTTSEDEKIDMMESFTTYHISTYATAEGYQDSEVVTTSFKWSKKNGDLNGDGYVNISDVTTLVNMILGK